MMEDQNMRHAKHDDAPFSSNSSSSSSALVSSNNYSAQVVYQEESIMDGLVTQQQQQQHEQQQQQHEQQQQQQQQQDSIEDTIAFNTRDISASNADTTSETPTAASVQMDTGQETADGIIAGTLSSDSNHVVVYDTGNQQYYRMHSRDDPTTAQTGNCDAHAIRTSSCDVKQNAPDSQTHCCSTDNPQHGEVIVSQVKGRAVGRTKKQTKPATDPKCRSNIIITRKSTETAGGHRASGRLQKKSSTGPGRSSSALDETTGGLSQTELTAQRAAIEKQYKCMKRTARLNARDELKRETPKTSLGSCPSTSKCAAGGAAISTEETGELPNNRTVPLISNEPNDVLEKNDDIIADVVPMYSGIEACTTDDISCTQVNVVSDTALLAGQSKAAKRKVTLSFLLNGDRRKKSAGKSEKLASKPKSSSTKLSKSAHTSNSKLPRTSRSSCSNSKKKTTTTTAARGRETHMTSSNVSPSASSRAREYVDNDEPSGVDSSCCRYANKSEAAEVRQPERYPDAAAPPSSSACDMDDAPTFRTHVEKALSDDREHFDMDVDNNNSHNNSCCSNYNNNNSCSNNNNNNSCCSNYNYSNNNEVHFCEILDSGRCSPQSDHGNNNNNSNPRHMQDVVAVEHLPQAEAQATFPRPSLPSLLSVQDEITEHTASKRRHGKKAGKAANPSGSSSHHASTAAAVERFRMTLKQNKQKLAASTPGRLADHRKAKGDDDDDRSGRNRRHGNSNDTVQQGTLPARDIEEDPDLGYLTECSVKWKYDVINERLLRMKTGLDDMKRDIQNIRAGFQVTAESFQRIDDDLRKTSSEIQEAVYLDEQIASLVEHEKKTRLQMVQINP